MAPLLTLTTPFTTGQRVKDAQYLLGHNKFGDFFDEKLDSEFGPYTASKAKRAKYLLGYPQNAVLPSFGTELRAYLLGDKALPLAYKARRSRRLKQLAEREIKLDALRIAKTQLGITESPAGSNNNKYGQWYGINYAPWCAMFVTWCFIQAGDTHIFAKGDRWAYVPFFYYSALHGFNSLALTTNPKPGDVVTYTFGHTNAHIGIFDTGDRNNFLAMEGNTSAGNNANGGAVQHRTRTGNQVTAFVHYPS